MKITVNLFGKGSPRDRPMERTEFEYTKEIGELINLQAEIKAAIGAWTLLPGDTITIEGDEELWR